MPCDIALFSKQARPPADSPSMRAEQSGGEQRCRTPTVARPSVFKTAPAPGRFALLIGSAEARELESHTHESGCAPLSRRARRLAGFASVNVEFA